MNGEGVKSCTVVLQEAEREKKRGRLSSGGNTKCHSHKCFHDRFVVVTSILFQSEQLETVKTERVLGEKRMWLVQALLSSSYSFVFLDLGKTNQCLKASAFEKAHGAG